ncbi:hypothetical protein P4S72_26130 [Vibrio sp. PP-XX7]
MDNSLLAAWQNRQVVEPEVWVYISDQGHYIMIEIQDNGTGIPDQIASTHTQIRSKFETDR